MIIAACGFFAQCSSPSYEKNDYFSAFENRNDIKRLLAKANAGDSIAQAEVSMAYRDYAYSVLDKYLDEKEARHVYDQAFMKRMYWLEKAVEGGEVYAMDTLADFYTSGIYGKGKFDDKVRLENIARDKGKALYWTMQLRRHTKDPEEIKDLDWWINALKNGEDISDCVGKCDD